MNNPRRTEEGSALAPFLSRKQFHFHCTPELYARLDAYRKAHGNAKGQPMARNAVLEAALVEFLEREGF